MKKFRPTRLQEDERGGFFAITRENWAEVNFIETEAGQMRGNHFHKRTRELFFIIAGEIEVTILSLHTNDRHEFELCKGDLLLVEPFEVHIFRTKTRSEWLNMLSEVLDPDQPDFHRPPEEP